MNTSQMTLDFDGQTYNREHDQQRLHTLLARVRTYMLACDGWRTLREIQDAISAGSETSVSARLRDLRKEKFGGYTVDRRARGDRSDGLFEYRVTS